jgi:hypothetical protein
MFSFFVDLLKSHPRILVGVFIRWLSSGYAPGASSSRVEAPFTDSLIPFI